MFIFYIVDYCEVQFLVNITANYKQKKYYQKLKVSWKRYSRELLTEAYPDILLHAQT